MFGHSMYRYGVLNPTKKETEGVRSGYVESGATGEYAGDEDGVREDRALE